MRQTQHSKWWNIGQDIDFVLFGAFLISFFLPTRINGFIAMLILIFAFVKWVSKRLFFKGFSGLFFFPVLFLGLLLGQFYSENLAQGWTIIERNISLLLMPIAAYGIVQISKKKTEYLFLIFALAAFVASVVCLAIAAYQSAVTGSIYLIPNNTHFLYNRFMHHNLTDPITLHAVYFASWIALINLVLLYRILTSKVTRFKLISWLALFLYFCFFLYLLKSANIAFGFVLSAILVIFITYRKKVFQSKLTVFALLLIITLLFFFGFQIIQTKLEDFSFAHDMSDLQLTPLGIRLSIWDCTWQAIRDNWVLGAGTGDAQAVLVESYQKNNFTIGLRDDFNAHNMYLQYWLSNGIFMLITWLIGWFILFRKSIQSKNIIFFAFLLIFAFFSFTEATLRTQKGLFFFVFFASIFYWKPSLWTFNSNES